MIALPVFSKEYFAKTEPYEIYTIAANTAGQVIATSQEREGQKLGSKPFVDMDDHLDRVELESVISKISHLETVLKLNEKIVANYEEIMAKKEANYERVKALKIKSTVEKDREFYDLAATQNQYLSTRKELENLHVQISDLKMRKAYLEKSILDKHPKAEGKVLYRLMVKPGQVVAPSTPLAEIADVSRAKLTLFLTPADVENVKHKRIYIDGKKSDYTITRLWNVADKQHLSSYKAEIIIDAPVRFSQLLKVEFKSE